MYHDISDLHYKETILQRNYREMTIKLPFYGHFPIIPL